MQKRYVLALAMVAGVGLLSAQQDLPARIKTRNVRRLRPRTPRMYRKALLAKARCSASGEARSSRLRRRRFPALRRSAGGCCRCRRAR